MEQVAPAALSPEASETVGQPAGYNAPPGSGATDVAGVVSDPGWTHVQPYGTRSADLGPDPAPPAQVPLPPPPPLPPQHPLAHGQLVDPLLATPLPPLPVEGLPDAVEPTELASAAPKRRVVRVVVAIIVVAAWWALIGPRAIGGPGGYVIVSGVSMEPTLMTGDLVVTRQKNHYEVGDVITYRVPEAGDSVVIHRIIGGDGHEGYVTQGDNRADADSWKPKDDDIIGAMAFDVPGVGKAFGWLRTPAGIAALSAFASFVISLTLLNSVRPHDIYQRRH